MWLSASYSLSIESDLCIITGSTASSTDGHGQIGHTSLNLTKLQLSRIVKQQPSSSIKRSSTCESSKTIKRDIGGGSRHESPSLREKMRLCYQLTRRRRSSPQTDAQAHARAAGWAHQRRGSELKKTLSSRIYGANRFSKFRSQRRFGCLP